MRFAFITDELPRPGSAGHLALNHEIVAWLQGGGHEVVVLLVRPRLRLPVERYEVARVEGPRLAVWGRHVVAGAPADVARIMGRYLRDCLPGWLRTMLRRRGRSVRYGLVDTALGAFVTAAERQWVASRVARLRPDGVLVDTMFRAAVLAEPQLAAVNSVVIAPDVFYLRHRALMTAGYRVQPSALTRDTEAGLLNLARAVVAIQPEQASLVQAMCPARTVCTASMPAIACRRPPADERLADRLVFVGSDSLPNLDGLRWFLADVWPRLKTWRNTVTLDIVGSCAAAIVDLPEGVTRAGRVKHLAPLLHRASLAIAPLRVGSGLKLKLLDYARHGLVTVATSASLKGFAPDPTAPFIAADDALSFTVAIADWLRTAKPFADERRAIEYVTKHYGIETSFAGLATVLGLQSAVISPGALLSDE